MQVVFVIRITLLLCVVCLGLCGCYTPPPLPGTGRFFRDSASADVVLVYHRWDHIFIVRPEYRDNGFQRPLAINDLDTAFDTLNVRRGMAVVVVGWSYDSREMQDIVSRWKSVLAPCGFRRIVCVFGKDNKKLDGTRIIDDWSPPEQFNQITKL